MAGRENALLCDVSFDNNVAELTCERRGRPLALVCAELASSANESSPKRTDSKRSDSNGG